MKNWKTTWTSVGATLTSALTVISLIPANFPPEMQEILPPNIRAYVFTAGLVATVILRALNGLAQADAVKPEPFPFYGRSKL